MALKDLIGRPDEARRRTLWAAQSCVSLDDAAGKTEVGDQLGSLAGRTVLIRTRAQIAAAQALIELDGSACRIVLCPPDLEERHLPGVIAAAGVDAIVSDAAAVLSATDLSGASGVRQAHVGRATEWVMFTSGTTGSPKMVVHTLDGLTGAIKNAGDPTVVWGTFYDIRRFGGLQILLRALAGGGSMVLSDPTETAAEHLGRLARHGVTHLTGTPSQWRRALMTPAIRTISPRYVRLSGEIVDQAVLDNLKTFFPGAGIGHAYASTEAGVGFEVNDGLEGFPAALVDRVDGPVEMRIQDDTLAIRSQRTAHCYVGEGAPELADPEGFVNAGDIVERRGDRYYFVGRRGGIINVGGLKVHPEEIESVINRHPAVRMSLARGRRNPITGAIVVADVVLNGDPADTQPAGGEAAIRDSILAACRETLAPFKVPASVRFVPALAVTPGGKLERQNA